jgi:voltage-gated potassium channel
VDERSRRIEAQLEPAVIVAALLVIPLIVIEESSLGQPWDAIAVALNWGTWLVFLGEALVMLGVVPNRRQWIKQHPLDVAVVVLTPPFLVAFAPIRLLRLLRLLRLVRLAPLARRLFTPQGVQYTAVIAGLIAVIGGAAFAALEGTDTSTADGIYWAVTTMTTVGYGDPPATTTLSKMLAVVVMLVGVGFVAILTGAVAQRFVAVEVEEEAEEIEAELDEASAAILRELGDLRVRLGSLEAAIRGRRRP